jgi:methylenetetrahydrofolate dehydrogenase (NADP+)/methenyltetrahydrofolate cyclohydrolase
MIQAANAIIIDGKKLAAQIREQVRLDTLTLAGKGVKPGLAVILVGEDPASAVYVRNKVAACEQAGFYSELQRYPATLSEAELLDHIKALNANPNIHGILVQLPLPKHIDAHKVIETIAAEKDVDGFHISNAGLLMTGSPLFRPCTPYGVMKMLEACNVSPWGAHACIVGASNIVGKPMAMLLLAAGATITICNSKTQDLAHHTRHADILVVATGRPNMITGDMIKPGATVIDVGINRLLDGKLCGDVDFESAKTVAGAITPVPGGVGPMTIAMLLVNTLEAAERSLSSTVVPTNL